MAARYMHRVQSAWYVGCMVVHTIFTELARVDVKVFRLQQRVAVVWRRHPRSTGSGRAVDGLDGLGRQ